MTTQTHPRLLKARIGLILDAPFFGSLVTRLKMLPRADIPTFCTDGVHIYYNEKFLDALTDEQLKYVLAHEVLHPALGHLWRIDGRNMQKWNAACDYQVNQILDAYADECRSRGQSTPWSMPTGQFAGLRDKAYDGLSSEETYRRLPDPPPGQSVTVCIGVGDFMQPAPDPDGKGKGDKSDGEGSAAGAESGLAGDWKIATIQAAMTAKAQGNCPGSIQRMIDEMLEPKVPWRQVLREFIRRRARDDYSFRKPNRRYAAQGVILPGMLSERMGPLVCAVDTSGSIGAHELAEFQAEIQAALDECSPERVEVIVCDAGVHGVQTFEPGDLVRIDAKGGGGTDFRPVFEHIEKNFEGEIEALIYLTDLMGTFPKEAPEYPTLWAGLGHGNAVPPFGELVAIK